LRSSLYLLPSHPCFRTRSCQRSGKVDISQAVLSSNTSTPTSSFSPNNILLRARHALEGPNAFRCATSRGKISGICHGFRCVFFPWVFFFFLVLLFCSKIDSTGVVFFAALQLGGSAFSSRPSFCFEKSASRSVLYPPQFYPDFRWRSVALSGASFVNWLILLKPFCAT